MDINTIIISILGIIGTIAGSFISAFFASARTKKKMETELQVRLTHIDDKIKTSDCINIELKNAIVNLNNTLQKIEITLTEHSKDIEYLKEDK